MASRDEIKDFSMLVEKLATDERLTLMDAICHYCKESQLEIEVAATMISSALKAKIREEAESLNLIKKNARLPI